MDAEFWNEGRGGLAVVLKKVLFMGWWVILLELLCQEDMRGRTVCVVRFSEVFNPRLMIPFDMKATVRLSKVTSACVGNSKS
ncbi:serine/threonine-protein kinase-like protein ACR4, partial [Trifolium medium]|nr:serine/threonine-protein kinase-like protein ACR4 [Trifolium medium]